MPEYYEESNGAIVVAIILTIALVVYDWITGKGAGR